MMAVRWLAVVTAVLVIIQAFLIGQALYVNGMTTVELHGWLGSGSFVLSLLLAGMAFLAYRRGEASTSLVAVAAAVVVLMVAQLGLGYIGRRGGLPASIHIPNGVLIAGLLFSLVQASLTSPAGAGSSRT